jgi:putative membrane-bound dehydrogenase-like protein
MKSSSVLRNVFGILWTAGFIGAVCAADKDPLEFPPPKSPQESLACIRTRDGLQVELVAAEPLIVDPVAIDWGPDGKLWVVEMRDYPMGMDGNWKPGSRIKLLEDTNGDGIYDKATVFLDNLPFATGVTAWRNGALICTAPDILYAEDTNGDGRADVVKKLFTGFATGNYQARVNSLSLGLDNWLYGANGLLGGIIRGEARGISGAGVSPATPGVSPAKALRTAGGETPRNTGGTPAPLPLQVDIRGRDFRMNPDTGAFEPASGLTQQGRARDDWGNWLGCDNSTAAWHYPIPDHYLRRNPYVAAPSPRVAIAAGVNGNLLYPISRTLERFNNPGAVNRVTSGCGIGVYRDELLGQEFYGNAFVCEPVHNLVHRMVLKPNGLTFSAVRAPDEQKSEFLASRDNWFRPVQMRTGPDGAIWVVDMYRFVIEHPRWIPPERLAKLDPRAGDDKGRIYRVYPKGQKLRPIRDLTKLSPAKLATLLDTPNGMERDRIHQELVFRRPEVQSLKSPSGKGRAVADQKTVKILAGLAEKAKTPAVRVQALCVLDGLGALTPGLVKHALSDPHAEVRANAIRLSERFARSADFQSAVSQVSNLPPPQSTQTPVTSPKAAPELRDALFKLVDDPDPKVRYQLALTLGEWDAPRATAALGRLAVRDMDDEWMRAAILSSADHQPAEILKAVLAADPSEPERPTLISQLIATAAGQGSPESLGKALAIIAPADDKHLEDWRLSALSSLLDALERKNLTLSAAAASLGPQAADSINKLQLIFDWAATLAPDPKAKDSRREAAIRLLGRRPERESADLALLERLLDPSVPARFQSAALDALKRNRNPQVAKLLLSSWNVLPPSLRQRAIEVLLSRDEWTRQLLAALENGAVGRTELSLPNRQLLLKSSNQEIVQSAKRIWSSNPAGSRAEVLANYQSALSLPGDPVKGRAIWLKNCVVCHYFRGEGGGVGPNLGALTDKTPADFLTAILDPNAAVEPRFVAYNIETKDGRSLTGIINAETATALTLVQSGGTHEKILRSDISEIRASGLSLMPEGLEQNMTPQDLANLIAYLNSAPHPFGTATPTQAETARRKFIAGGINGLDAILAAADRHPYPSWMGELPRPVCRQTEGQTRLAWETAPVPAELKPDDAHEFRLPVSMGYGGGPSGRFSLRLNGKPALDFDVALHDQAWQSADGKVRMSYMTMEDSPQESNGILTITVSGSLLDPGKRATFEVIGPAANSQRWFGVYLVSATPAQATR